MTNPQSWRERLDEVLVEILGFRKKGRRYYETTDIADVDVTDDVKALIAFIESVEKEAEQRGYEKSQAMTELLIGSRLDKLEDVEPVKAYKAELREKIKELCDDLPAKRLRSTLNGSTSPMTEREVELIQRGIRLAKDLV